MATIPALYCHIPFCHTICPFCAFAVHGNRAGLQRPYLDALKHLLGVTTDPSSIVWKVQTTSSAENGRPSWKRTPLRRWKR